MITKITGEQPFQVLTNNFSISPSSEGYTLQISADGKNYSNLFTVGAGVTRLVTGVAANSFYRLSGNQSQVSINWMKTCVTEGGSGGSGTGLSPVTEFPLDAEAGTVVAYNGTASASGVYQYTGEEWVPVGVDDLSAYWTSAQTQSAITIVEDHLYDVEQVTASALTELHDQINVMDEVVANSLVDLNDRIVELSGSSVDLSAYYTSAQTEDAISAATSGKADKANLSTGDTNPGDFWFPKWNEQGIITGKTGLRNFQIRFDINGIRNRVTSPDNGYIPSIWAPNSVGTAGDILVSTGNGAPVWSAMPAADVTKAYVDSAITEVQDQIDTMDDVVSAALVDLNTRKVESSSVSTIWKGTAAEYNAIVNKDPKTLYIIVDNV